MLKNSQIKRENKRIIKLREQSKRKQNCKSCKYIRLSELTMGYECYVCKLYDPDFSNSKIENIKNIWRELNMKKVKGRYARKALKEYNIKRKDLLFMAKSYLMFGKRS